MIPAAGAGIPGAFGSRRSTAASAPVDPYPTTISDAWASLKSQPASVWFLLAFVILEYVRPQSQYPVIDVLPYGEIVLIGGLISLLNDKTITTYAKTGLNYLMALYAVLVIISVVASPYPFYGFGEWRKITLWFIVYFMVANASSTRDRYYLFLCLYLLCNFKMSQHGTLSWAERGFSLSQHGVQGAPGYFHNSGELAIQMCVFAPLGWYFYLGMRDRVGLWLGRALLALPGTAAITIVACNTRGGLLGLAAAGGYILVVERNFKAIFAMFAAVAAVLIVMPPQLASRFEDMGTDETSRTRLTYWENAIEIMLDHPITGIGYATWGPYYGENFGKVEWYFMTHVEVCHNIFLEAGSELGFPGLFCFWAMLLACFMINGHSRKLALEMDDWLMACVARGMNAGSIGFIVSGQFVTVLYYPYFWFGAAMTVGLNFAMTKAHKEFLRNQRRAQEAQDAVPIAGDSVQDAFEWPRGNPWGVEQRPMRPGF